MYKQKPVTFNEKIRNLFFQKLNLFKIKTPGRDYQDKEKWLKTK